MLKKVVKSITPPIVMEMARWALGRQGRGSKTSRMPDADLIGDENSLEFIDFWGNTSLFALEVAQRHAPLKQMRLLSIGNRMAHVADYIGLFRTVYHSTTLKTAFPVSADNSPSELVLLEEDFFDLPSMNVDCIISQAAIHCLNDSRYGNLGTAAGWQRPYQAAAKLRQIIGERSIPVVVSIAVHRTEALIDDNARLAHEKFVQSFLDAGFSLQEFFFDYLCFGMPQLTKYLDVRYRRAKDLPTEEQAPSEYNYVIGNYYFL